MLQPTLPLELSRSERRHWDSDTEPLGAYMTLSIQIAGQPVSRLEGESHSIGSDARCAIRVAGSDVAPRHALLRRVAGRWLVEAAGDQLIRIGEGRPTRLAWLNPGDEIYVSTDGPPLVFEPADTSAPARTLPAANAAGPVISASNSASGPQRSVASPTSTEGQRQSLWFAVGGAGLLAAGILLTVVILNLSGAFRRDASEKAASGSGHPAESSVTSSGVPASPDAPSTTTSGETASSQPSSGVELSDSLYLVQVVAEGNQQIFRLGTAWAITPRKLITSGAVAAGMQALRDVAPTARVASADGKQTLAIRSFKLHPAYESALKEATHAQGEAEGLRLELEKPQADVNALTERLIAVEERRFQAFERQTGVDLALLEVDGDLPHPLSVAKPQSRTLKVGNRVRLGGFPFKPDDFIVDPDLSSPVSTVDATVGTVTNGSSSRPSYWRIRTGTDLGSDNWSGGPVVDATGRVVGTYSRPTPPPPGRAPPETWILHDVADIEGLSAFGESWQ